MADNNLPMAIFPGLQTRDIVSDAVREIAVSFNAEGIDALSAIPEQSVAWADVGTRVTAGMFEAKIPVRLTSLLGYNKFTGERSYHQAGVASVNVRTAPFDMNMEYDIRFNQAGIAELINYYGLNGLPGDMVAHARAAKADMLASLLMAGFTNSHLGVTAQALTLAQPGYTSGLPLFSDGSTSGASEHFSNPLDGNSRTFKNLFLAAGKLTDNGVFETMLTNMQKVPHPTKLNMNLGLGVTDIIGPSHMIGPFREMAVRQLSLQTTTSPGNLAAATTNIYNNESLMKAAQMISAAGMTPVRYWIAPQLDAHPYITHSGNAAKQMWIAVAAGTKGSWAEFIAPSAQFTPRVTILGDGSEEAIKTRKVRIISDLDAGVAAGLPHFAAMYFEDTPA